MANTDPWLYINWMLNKEWGLSDGNPALAGMDEYFNSDKSSLSETAAEAYREESGMSQVCYRCKKQIRIDYVGHSVIDGKQIYYHLDERSCRDIIDTLEPCPECAVKDAEADRLKRISESAWRRVREILNRYRKQLAEKDAEIEGLRDRLEEADRIAQDYKRERDQSRTGAIFLRNSLDRRQRERECDRQLAADLIGVIRVSEKTQSHWRTSEAIESLRKKYPWLVFCRDCGKLGAMICDQCLERRR